MTLQTDSNAHSAAPGPSDDWEAVVGGNWLNKLGVLVLVVGLSLFLGYSLAQLGPASRVAVGAVGTGVLLVTGIIVERNPRYVVFGRGLIGGGWAGLYFTTYAMHALPSARIIDNPLTATTALLSVAGGMIAHSIRYRSQVVTGLAYFVAFATLAISPVTTFSLVASIPLAMSLLVVAQRHSWAGMGVLGLLTTYGASAASMTSLQERSVGQYAIEQTVLASYWLLFEAFDLVLTLRMRARSPLLLSLNACAFVGISLLRWSAFEPFQAYLFLVCTAGAYLLGTVARAVLLKPVVAEEGQERPFADARYAWSITVTVGLLVPAILLRFDGLQINVALLLIGEMLFLSSLRLFDRYLRCLGTGVLALAAGKIVLFDLQMSTHVTLGAWQVLSWTPVAMLTALIFYGNRTLLASRHLLPIDQGYTWVASLLLGVTAAFDAPSGHVGTAWLGLALVLIEIWRRSRFEELRPQAYALGALALGVMARYDIEDGLLPGASTPAVHAALAYTVFGRLARARPALPHIEQQLVSTICSWCGAFFLALIVGRVVPEPWRGIGWLCLAAVLFEVGIRARSHDFRRQAYMLSIPATVLVFVHAFPDVVRVLPVLAQLASAAVLFWAAFERVRRVEPDRLDPNERPVVANVTAVAGTAVLAAVMWQLLPVPVVAIGWAVLGVLLLDVGAALSAGSLRTLGHLMLSLMLGRLLMANLPSEGATLGMSHRLLTALPITGLLYFISSWMRAGVSKTSDNERLARVYLYAATTVATLLLGFELERALAAAGWAIEALLLLSFAGHWRMTDLRRQAYLVGLLVFLRSAATNFEMNIGINDTSYRLAVAGVVIASFYVAQFIVRRITAGATAERGSIDGLFTTMDRHGASIFSLMGSLLLAQVLFNETSAQVVTIAWALQGIALLATGFCLRDAILRRSGLLMLAVCTVKVFAYDFRALDTLSRILSFIVLGMLMLLASWAYARFRERLQQFI